MVGNGQPATQRETEHPQRNPLVTRQRAEHVELILNHFVGDTSLGLGLIEDDGAKQNDCGDNQGGRESRQKPVAPGKLVAHVGRQKAPRDQAGGGTREEEETKLAQAQEARHKKSGRCFRRIFVTQAIGEVE